MYLGAKLWQLLLLFSFIGLVHETFAASIRLIQPPPTDNFASHARLQIVGPIEKGDSERLPALLRAATARSSAADQGKPDFYHSPLLLLDSPGGDIIEAIRIGRYLRDSMASVIVPAGATCASACVLVLVGGVFRYVLGAAPGAPIRIGIHRISIEDPRFADLEPRRAIEEYNKLKVLVRTYLQDMGISDRFYEQMFDVGSEDIYWLPRNVLNDMLVTGEDPAYREWLRAKEIQHWGKA